MSILKLLDDKKFKDKVLSKEESIKNLGFINTGCATLNILYSGRIDGGIPIGKASQIAAPSQLGKSMIALKLVKNAQKKGIQIVYIDTEHAFDFNFAEQIGIDTSPDKVRVFDEGSLEEVQQLIATFSEKVPDEEKKNIMIVIDSWGGFSTSKTIDDAVSGKDVLDMTISKKKNSLARIIMRSKITTFIVNHIYDNIGSMYDPLKISGGRGIFYACSSIVLGTSKAKEKEKSGDNAGEILGSIITARCEKSRFAREHSKLKYSIKSDSGIHPYYGLLDDAIEMGFIDKPSTGYYSRPCVPDDKKWREKQIWEDNSFWVPILKETDFMSKIQEKYTFVTAEMSDEDFELSNNERED
jgi:RecA/RadA recombinase